MLAGWRDIINVACSSVSASCCCFCSERGESCGCALLLAGVVATGGGGGLCAWRADEMEWTGGNCNTAGEESTLSSPASSC